MTAIPTSSDLHQMRDQLAEEIRRFAIDRRLPDGTWRDPNDRERAMRMTNAYAALESRIRDEDMWRDEAPEVPEVGLDDASRDARDQLDALVDQASAWARETPPLPDVGAGDNNAYRTAFCRYVARGAGALSASEFGLLQARTSQLRADGHPSFRNEGSQGITAPPVIANQIIRAEKSFGGLDGAAITRHVSTGFETMEWPVEVDNDEGEWSGDDRTSTGETSIPTQRVLPLDLHSLDSRFIV
ncbi:MAG: phage major capsid protein, partial [Acidobacteriota bacterium]